MQGRTRGGGFLVARKPPNPALLCDPYGNVQGWMNMQHPAFSMLISSKQIVGLDENATAEVGDKVYAHSVARLLASVFVRENITDL